MSALLSGMAARTPVLFFVDDLQYAGQSTVEFLHYLARHVHDCRLLAVVTVRAEHAAEIGSVLEPVAARVEVGPLSAAAVGQLARAAGQGGLAGFIVQRTRGHTLFVVEVLRAMAGGDPDIPESLRSAVQARVRQTGAAADALLRAASVLDPRSTRWSSATCSASRQPTFWSCASWRSRRGCWWSVPGLRVRQ